MPRPKSSSRKKILEAVQSSTQEVLSKVILVGWLAAVAVGGWYLYQKAHPAEMPHISWIESKSTPLIGALETYHQDHGEYPKLLRDLTAAPTKYGMNFIYSGEKRVPVVTEDCVETPLSDGCWTGYRGYGLLVVSKGNTYVYSSSEGRWREEASAEIPEELAA